MKYMRVRLTFTDPLLGTTPANKQLLTDFVASKAPDADRADEEAARSADGEKGLTVFPRDGEGRPMVWDYQIKGMFKDSCGMLARVKGKTESAGIKAYKKVIDGLIFIAPREIAIDSPEPPTILERPLRAMTPQGERVSLVASEAVPEGASIEFTISLMDDELEDAVREWLDYGALRGLGQWRNSGKGRYVWEEIS